MNGDVTRKAVLIASTKLVAAREVLEAILTTGPDNVMASGADLKKQLEQGNNAVLPYMMENTRSSEVDDMLLNDQVTGGQNGHPEAPRA